MGRHSQSDLGDAASTSPGPASRPVATGEPSWDLWWEKTGSQPRIVDPLLDEPVRGAPMAAFGAPPLTGPPTGPPPAPLGRSAGTSFRGLEPATAAGRLPGPADSPLPPNGHGRPNGHGALPAPVEPALPPVSIGGRRSPSGSVEPAPPLDRRLPGASAEGPPSGPADARARPWSGRPGSAARAADAVPASPPPPGPSSTGPIGLSPAFPLTPDEPAQSRRSLRSVPGSGESGRPGPVRGAAMGRGGRAAGYPGAAATAAAVPLSYDTSPGLARNTAETPAVPAERGRLADPTGRRAAGGGPGTAILPAPGLRAAPSSDGTGETPRVAVAADPATGRSGVRALPDPDAYPSTPSRSGRSGRAGRGRRGEDPADTAERDWVASLRSPAEPTDAAEREPSVRSLHAVDSDPDSSEHTGIHYGFEDEPSLLLQWGGFIVQTVVGAACGLGVWLGFYQLWDRWPFYTAPAAGAAMAIMLAITRSIRRRYGHELDLLTAVLAVGVGVVLTVLPAAFVLQHV